MNGSIGLEQIVKQTGVFRCLECGKCTAVCPISRYDAHFSPRRTVGRALMRRDQALLADDRLWACLTCLHCSQVCPAAVDYPDLTLSVRTEARQRGQAAVCTHGEAIHAWMRMMMDPGLKQNRLGWLEEASDSVPHSAYSVSRITHYHPHLPLRAAPGEPVEGHSSFRLSKDSDTLYFTGCAPYFDVQFGHVGVDGRRVMRSTVRVLNALDIEPQVLADERCCGHDLLWEGDVEGFRALAGLNAALIRDSGAKRVVTACPECARALRVDYAAHGIDLDVQVLHLAELLASDEAQSALPQSTSLANEPSNNLTNTPVTYQDPCRLGRHLGAYDAPRQVIRALGMELIEMPRNRENALCCGTNGWSHCGAANRQIQGDRLQEAQTTGAELLVTACLKCQIHFQCALQDRELGAETAVKIKDLATLVAEALDFAARQA
jgi:Fe-S oxidoreductase